MSNLSHLGILSNLLFSIEKSLDPISESTSNHVALSTLGRLLVLLLGILIITIMSENDFYKKWFETTVSADNMHLFEEKHGKKAVPKKCQMIRCCCGLHFEEEYKDFRCLTCNVVICDNGDCGWYCNGDGGCNREERWCKDCIPKSCPYPKIAQDLAKGKELWQVDIELCDACYKAWKKRKVGH